MSAHDFQSLLDHYWSSSALAINLVVFLNLLGALVLGALVGYERSFHGRAAGMRTYGLVCMASAGLTIITGYPSHWWGGTQTVNLLADPTRVVQGVVTGVGFLGAGVIMKDGLNISGLTTAASIWSASAIGVLIGVGFYASAILLAGLSAATMMWGSRVESWLPSHHALAVGVRFHPGKAPALGELSRFLRHFNYSLATGSLTVNGGISAEEWKFVAVVVDRRLAAPMDSLARELSRYAPIESFSLAHARN